MPLPGKRLREVREALRLRYRDVEQASQKIATLRRNPEFIIGLSRLADIENKGTLPTVYRLYSLCVIYRLEFTSVLRWYGIALDDLPADAGQLALSETHLLDFEANERTPALLPLEFDPDFDPSRTSFISRQVQILGPNSCRLARRRRSSKAPLRIYRVGGLVHVSDFDSGFVYSNR